MKEQIRHYKTDEVEAQDRCWKEFTNVTFRSIIPTFLVQKLVVCSVFFAK